MPLWLTYTLIMLTIFRVTRFIVQDTFPPLGVPRDHLINWWSPDEDWIADHPKATAHWGPLGRSLRYLFTCPWCMSVWVGPPVIWAFTLYVSVPLPVAVWIVGSAATGLIARNFDPD